MPVGQALHRKIMNDFRQYILVGGMPQSVLAYVDHKDFAVSDEAKRRILRLYREDIGKLVGTYFICDYYYLFYNLKFVYNYFLTATFVVTHTTHKYYITYY